MALAYACSAVIDRLVDMADHRPLGSISAANLREAAACVADAARAAGAEDGVPQPQTPAADDRHRRFERITTTIRELGCEQIGRARMAALFAKAANKLLAEIEAHPA